MLPTKDGAQLPPTAGATLETRLGSPQKQGIVVKTNGVFAEVPQSTIILCRASLYQIDTWTDRLFKCFAANAHCYLNALQTNFDSKAITWPTGPMHLTQIAAFPPMLPHVAAF